MLHELPMICIKIAKEELALHLRKQQVTILTLQTQLRAPSWNNETQVILGIVRKCTNRVGAGVTKYSQIN